MKEKVEVVFQAMLPSAFYRPVDVRAASGVSGNNLYRSLDHLVNGGLVERLVDGNRKVYITKQAQLF